jgi:hypothetical protein
VYTNIKRGREVGEEIHPEYEGYGNIGFPSIMDEDEIIIL